MEKNVDFTYFTLSGSPFFLTHVPRVSRQSVYGFLDSEGEQHHEDPGTFSYRDMEARDNRYGTYCTYS